eukprot:gene2947-biopygen1384
MSCHEEGFRRNRAGIKAANPSRGIGRFDSSSIPVANTLL